MPIAGYIAIAGFGWYIFFSWMRGWKRYQKVGTQHLCLLSLLGLAVAIGSLIGLIAGKVFSK
jgi:hypothetical protein